MKEKIEIDFSYMNLPRKQVIEYTFLPSGRIVVMTDEDSFWFESSGISPKGSYLIPCPKIDVNRIERIRQSYIKAKATFCNGSLNDDGFKLSPETMNNLLNDVGYLLR